jgi:hypothetical protein
MIGAQPSCGLKVGGGLDGRAPPVNGWRKKKKRGGAVGPTGEGVAGPVGPLARASAGEKAGGPGWLRWLRENKRKAGRGSGPQERERGKEFSFF